MRKTDRRKILCWFLCAWWGTCKHNNSYEKYFLLEAETDQDSSLLSFLYLAVVLGKQNLSTIVSYSFTEIISSKLCTIHKQLFLYAFIYIPNSTKYSVSAAQHLRILGLYGGTICCNNNSNVPRPKVAGHSNSSYMLILTFKCVKRAH